MNAVPELPKRNIRRGSISFRVGSFILATCAALALSGLISVWFVNRFAMFEVDIKDDGRRIVSVYTPLRDFRFGGRPKRIETMSAAIYPKSVWTQETSSDFYQTPSNEALKSAQFTMLRFKDSGHFEAVATWYERKLGSDFPKSRAWAPDVPPGSAEWKYQVSSRPIEDCVLFERDEDGLLDGVMLQPGRDGRDVIISLFEYRQHQN